MVEAEFGGRHVGFALSSEAKAVASLEAAIGSPFAAFRRFAGSEWTVTDVRQVLAHAYPGAMLLHRLTRVDEVEAAIAAAPAATYAPLAGKILETFLFGEKA